ncbi:hypothetical protein DL93DRAFT_2162854 [Clavulina sp. PMI_390]|nr:hypothetical protein DL93DRAFT_2162854 [Clavulina sp. PMI_390]
MSNISESLARTLQRVSPGETPQSRRSRVSPGRFSAFSPAASTPIISRRFPQRINIFETPRTSSRRWEERVMDREGVTAWEADESSQRHQNDRRHRAGHSMSPEAESERHLPEGRANEVVYSADTISRTLMREVPQAEGTSLHKLGDSSNGVIIHCPICLEDIPHSNIVAMVPCGHTFCTGCSNTITHNNPQFGAVLPAHCPVCRTFLSTDSGPLKIFLNTVYAPIPPPAHSSSCEVSELLLESAPSIMPKLPQRLNLLNNTITALERSNKILRGRLTTSHLSVDALKLGKRMLWEQVDQLMQAQSSFRRTIEQLTFEVHQLRKNAEHSSRIEMLANATIERLISENAALLERYTRGGKLTESPKTGVFNPLTSSPALPTTAQPDYIRYRSDVGASDRTLLRSIASPQVRARPTITIPVAPQDHDIEEPKNQQENQPNPKFSTSFRRSVRSAL